MELNDDLRDMLKELGQAINESISGSGRVHDSIQRIRDEGYNLYMVLDAKVGVNRRAPRAGNRRRPAAAGNGRTRAGREQAAFGSTSGPAFLEVRRHDPTRKVRNRRVISSRLALRRSPTRA
jgi:hypothetical protein